MNFTTSQQKAIDSDSPMILAVACAGSGKTTVLTQKVKNMLIEGKEVYVITFTNKATDELKRRLGDYSMIAKISTIHKLAYDTINQNKGESIYRNHKFLLNDKKNSILIKLMKDHKLFIMYKKLFVLANGGQLDDDELVITKTDRYNFEKLMEHYEKYKKDNNLFDVSEILDIALAIMKEIDLYYNCDALFVDEFQDVSPTDYEFISRFNCDKFLVGDQNQSIYGFRGAEVGIISSLQSDDVFENIEIDTNFRCRENIISYSNQFMSNPLDVKHVKKLGFVKEHVYNNIYDIMDSVSRLLDNGYTILVRWNRNLKLLREHFGEDVNATTIHKAKGLEYPKVCIVMDKSLVEQDMNEEKRVLYVGSTRAEDELVVYIHQDLYLQVKN